MWGHTGGMLRAGWGEMDFQQFDDAAQFLLTTDGQAHLAPGPQGRIGEGRGDHPAVYRNFHAAILHGEPISADATEGRKSLELANAIIYSSKTARPTSRWTGYRRRAWRSRRANNSCM